MVQNNVLHQFVSGAIKKNSYNKTDNLHPQMVICDTNFPILLCLYRNDPKFSDRYAWANSADPDQTAPRGAV